MDQAKVGQFARVLTECSEYQALVGQVIEVTRHQSVMLRFSTIELQAANRPERVLCARDSVHFYLRELQEVNVYEGGSTNSTKRKRN